MIVKRTQKKSNVVLYAFLFLFITYYSLRCFTAVEKVGEFQLDILTQEMDNIFKITTPLTLNADNLVYSCGISLFVIMIIETFKMQTKKNIQENSMGSSEWEDPNATKKIKDEDFTNNFIFTKTEIISKNMRKTGLNLNITMCGRPGSGKSRFIYKNNLLNANGETIICTDPKGELLRSCGYSLKQQGYTIKVLNLVEKWKGNHYNPLHYIKRLPKDAPTIRDIEKSFNAGEHPMIKTQEQLEKAVNEMIQEDDVMRLINLLMANTKGENIDQTTGDPYWEHATNLYLQSLIYLAKWRERYHNEPANFERVLELIRMSKTDEDEERSKVDMFYEEIREVEPNYIGIKQWDHFKITAKSQKMLVTIIMEATVRIASFNIREVAEMTQDDDMELYRIGKAGAEGRIIYFIITDPMDSTYNFLASLFYSQVFTIIDTNAKANNGQCENLVMMYMEEFAQLGDIPRFVETLAYIRGLNAGCLIGLQSLSQLKGKYKDSWETVLDCCDTFLFLGSKSKETLEYVSTLMGKKTWYKKSSGRTTSKNNSSTYTWDVQGRELAMIDELERMPKGHAVVLMGEYFPFYSELYDISKNPRYEELYEEWQKGNQDNDAKLYLHEKEVKKSNNQLKWESIARQYCINYHLPFKNVKLPFERKEEVTTNLTKKELKKYMQTGGFLSKKQEQKLMKEN